MPQTRHYEMKDSGVEWIGEMPSHWQYTPLKYLASCNDEVLTEATPEDYTFDYIDIGSVHTGNGIGICERMQFKDAPSRARRIVRDGDIIVSTVRTYLKAIAQVGNYDVPHIASTGFAVIRTKNANASFLKYALLSDNFVSQVEADSVGISYPAINASQIMTFKIPVPPLSEQTAIAAYLDEKCATIDAIISEAKSSIEEYKSWKASVIFETVTKGLNPNAEMKDSGVEWIGEIPSHWDTSRIKNECINLDSLREPISAENRININRLYDYYGASGVIDKIDDYNVDDTVILIGEDGANLVFRNLPLVYRASGKFWVNNHAHILKVKEKNDYGFMAYMLEAGDYTNFITGSAQPKLTQSNLMRFPIPVPPLTEQTAIAAYLDSKCAAIDAIILEKEELIKELEHYKRSLIFEAVTGKRRVC